MPTPIAQNKTPINKTGVRSKAGDKTRTCGRLITNQLLYQLSYTSIVLNQYNHKVPHWRKLSAEFSAHRP